MVPPLFASSHRVGARLLMRGNGRIPYAAGVSSAETRAPHRLAGDFGEITARGSSQPMASRLLWRFPAYSSRSSPVRIINQSCCAATSVYARCGWLAIGGGRLKSRRAGLPRGQPQNPPSRVSPRLPETTYVRRGQSTQADFVAAGPSGAVLTASLTSYASRPAHLSPWRWRPPGV